jgi:hypothetical protein
VLNRHVIVLLLGSAALQLLRPYPPAVFGTLGVAFFSILIGLLLDGGRTDFRSRAGRWLQWAGILLLLYATGAAVAAGAAEPHFLLAQWGIALAVLGSVLEQLLDYRLLRLAIAVQAGGDLLYLSGFAVALALRNQRPSAVGWTFIALATALGVFASLYNLILQLRRMKNRQAGWRYRVAGQEIEGLLLKTPSGETLIPWRQVQTIQRIDRRHLIFVLPAPLPGSLSGSDLPWEELYSSAEPASEASARPDRYGLILHEQELGCGLSEAERSLARHLSAAEPAS